MQKITSHMTTVKKPKETTRPINVITCATMRGATIFVWTVFILRSGAHLLVSICAVMIF
jgi:hypothetical protein